MEGWDGTADGRPSDLTRRRWGSFGRSGAALIWGGEAFAVRHDGRANPNQLALGPHAEADLVSLRTHLVEEHAARHRPDRWPGHRAAAHPLGPLRAAQPGRTLGADHGLRAPRPRSALPRRHAGPHVHRRRARRPRRRLRARRDRGPRRRLRLRRRQALPRLPGTRAAQRVGSARPATAARPAAPRSCGASSTASAATRRGWRSASACRPSTRCRSARTRAASARRKPTWRRTGTPSGCSPIRPPRPIWSRPAPSCASSRAWASAGCRSAPAARTTTRTSSARRCSRRRTATCRPRIRWSAAPGRSRRSARSSATSRTCG